MKYSVILTNRKCGTDKHLKSIEHLNLHDIFTKCKFNWLAIATNPQNEKVVFEANRISECKEFMNSYKG